MKNASRLYNALLSFVGQCAWADQRHAYVLVWMVIGVIARWECESDAQEERTCKPQPKMPRAPSGDFPVGCTTPGLHPTHLYSPLIQADKSRLGRAGALPEFRYDDAVGYVLRQTLVGGLSGSSYSCYLAGAGAW